MSTVAAILPKALRAKEIVKDLSQEELEKLAKPDALPTASGSAAYITRVRSRSAKNTYIVANETFPVGVRQQQYPKEKALAVLEEVHSYLEGVKLLQVDSMLGEPTSKAIPCRLYVTADYPRLAHMWHCNLFPSSSETPPKLVTIDVPEWKERLILVDPEQGYTYILGSDYFGEVKMSFLRQAMVAMKKEGGLGLHAGSKIVKVKREGALKEVGFLLFGLSGTGKTTLTLHDHELKGEEGVAILQDDVVLIREDAFCYGTEDRYYIKTEGLDEHQPGLLRAAKDQSAILENIKITTEGIPDFKNSELTTNGRAIVRRDKIPNTVETIDLPRADKLILITRRDDVVPLVAKLSPLQGAAFFMLGESIETSAGDPTRAGQAKREVGTNPFIIGPEEDEGHKMLEILTANPEVETFLLNTGSIGKGGKSSGGVKVPVSVSTAIMREIARGTISWTKDPDWGYEVPTALPGVPLEKFDPKAHYEEKDYGDRVERLRRERLKWLEQFPGLKKEIVEALQ